MFITFFADQWDYYTLCCNSMNIAEKKLNFYATNTENIDFCYNDTFILHHL